MVEHTSSEATPPDDDGPLSGGLPDVDTAFESDRSRFGRWVRDGTAALAIGGVLLWRGLASIRCGRLRGFVPGVVGIVAIRKGIRQRHSDGTEDADNEWSGEELASDDPWDDDNGVADEAHAATDAADQRDRPVEPSPTTESRAGAESISPSKGDSSEADTTPDTSLDPRDDDEDDARITEATVADEPGEATGPTPAQAEPTRSIDSAADPDSGTPGAGAETDRSPSSDEGDESVTGEGVDRPQADHQSAGANGESPRQDETDVAAEGSAARVDSASDSHGPESEESGSESGSSDSDSDSEDDGTRLKGQWKPDEDDTHDEDG